MAQKKNEKIMLSKLRTISKYSILDAFLLHFFFCSFYYFVTENALAQTPNLTFKMEICCGFYHENSHL